MNDLVVPEKPRNGTDCWCPHRRPGFWNPWLSRVLSTTEGFTETDASVVI